MSAKTPPMNVNRNGNAHTHGALTTWVWALPFLFTFIGGVFADILESRQRKLFLVLSIAILVTQAALCWTSLAGLTL